jgi:hypothetical protein
MKNYLNKLPAFILAAGGIIRIAGAGSAAIWFDESLTVYRSSIPFMTLFQEHSERSGDLLLELILRPILLLGHSLWLVRLPSMLAAIAGLWMVYKLMDRLGFSLNQKIVSSCLVAFLPGMLWLGQDARSYGILSLLFLGAVWFALEGSWLGLFATCGLMVYAHNTGPLMAAAALLVTWFLRPSQFRFIVIVGAAAFLTWIPAIIRMLDYPLIHAPWAPLLTLPWLVNSAMGSLFPLPGRVDFNLTVFLTIFTIPLILCFCLLAILLDKQPNGRVVSLIGWLVPVSLMVLFCLVLKENILNYRTLMPMLFPFCLWLGWELGMEGWIYYALLTPWTAVLIGGFILYNPAYRGGGLDRIAAEIRAEWKPGDQLVYTTVTVGLPFDYYLNDLPHTWNDIIQDPYFLRVPTIHRTSLVGTVGASGREWIIIPKEPEIITSLEQLELMKLVHYQQPTWTLNYIQTAPIQVYLVEVK